MSKRIAILENIRSAYNVWNIIRTADSLGREVRIIWYTPSPVDNPKVCKTSLWAENTVWLRQFDFTIDAIKEAREMWLEIIAAELTENSVPLWEYVCKSENWIAIIFWNEVDGVMEKTLKEALGKVPEIVADGDPLFPEFSQVAWSLAYGRHSQTSTPTR